MSRSRYRRSHRDEPMPDVEPGLSREAASGLSPKSIAARSRAGTERRDGQARDGRAHELAERVADALPPARPTVQVPAPKPKTPQIDSQGVSAPSQPWRKGGLRVSTTRPSQRRPDFDDGDLVALSTLVQRECRAPSTPAPVRRSPVPPAPGRDTSRRTTF